MTKSNTRATADVAHVVGRKNLIINGGFDVWQRGTSLTLSGSNKYSADRWKAHMWNSSWGDTSATFEKVEVEGLNALKVTGSSDLRFFYFHQLIEDARILRGKEVTVSFYAKVDSGSVSANPRLVARPSNTATPSTSLTVGTLWEKHEATFVMPTHTDAGSDSSTMLYIFEGVDFRNKVFYISNVQLELCGY